MQVSSLGGSGLGRCCIIFDREDNDLYTAAVAPSPDKARVRATVILICRSFYLNRVLRLMMDFADSEGPLAVEAGPAHQ